MAYIDAHCHLADSRFDGDREAALERAADAGLGGFVQGGVGPEDWARQQTLADPRWRLAFGLHPWWVAERDEAACEDALAKLETLVDRAPILGELGLDFHPKLPRASHGRQEVVFRRQLELARRRDKPLALHVVQAHGPAIEILKKAGGAFRGIVHGFTGSWETARAYLDLGLLISVGGALTREGYRKLKTAVGRIPPDRLVIESDAPDMAPAAHSGERNEPAFIWETARAAAALRNETAEGLMARAAANAKRAFAWETAP